MAIDRRRCQARRPFMFFVSLSLLSDMGGAFVLNTAAPRCATSALSSLSGPGSSRQGRLSHASVALAKKERYSDGGRPLPEEEDDLGDEVSRIVGYESGKKGSRRRSSPAVQWLKDLYYKIFWFGLDFGEEDDDEYMDEIDWFGGWNGADDGLDQASWDMAGDRGGQQQVFRGKKVRASGDNTVVRRTGVREEPPVWENTASATLRDEVGSGSRPRRRTAQASGRTSTGRPMSLARKVGPPRRDRAQLEGDMARLQEKREVLRVSREVWKKRIADMLTSMDELDDGKLTRARARLQQINEELADVDIELKELSFLLDIESRRGAQGGSSSSSRKEPMTGSDSASSAAVESDV